ncbi:sensor histidine kinase [Roseateles amylovorans]|jgi:signal transduction histidine kinase|uniref:histidine kinase n=1 Tax=Roseateles amylovorans TaxID=2978473 RepID=A0ABY6B2L8_9BURK|nr:ATP-binding protein [Roseateles amylovorans]UXH79434.1 ATP-binding protein [Roseateles amylovorans]
MNGMHHSAARKSETPAPRRPGTCRSPRNDAPRKLVGRLRSGSIAEALTAAEARERERIACLLHDDVGSLIVQMRLRLGEWRHAPQRPDNVEMEELCSWLSRLSHTVRTLTTAVAPPSWHGGLGTALADLAREMRLGLSGAAPEFRIDTAEPEFDIPAPLRTVVCRVVRELCLNVVKHARAGQVDITPRLLDGWLCIRVQDDGVGFPVDAGAEGEADSERDSHCLPASEITTAVCAKQDALAARPGAGDPLVHADTSADRAPCVAPGPTPRPRAEGLGLAGARAQLRTLGGSLHLQSVPGRGTCATVLVPVRGLTTRSLP